VCRGLPHACRGRETYANPVQILLDRNRTDLLKCGNNVMESCVREPGAGSISVLGRRAQRPGPSRAAPRRRISRCAPGDWFPAIDSPPVPSDTSRPARSRMDCGIIRPAQPSRASASQLPTPGRRGLQVTQPSLLAGRRMGSRGRPPAASVAGERQRPPQARATRTRNPWHRAPETVSSHGRELSRLPASSAAGGGED